MLFHESKKENIFSVFRIIGNEMPPRDIPDARLKTLNFILENEPDLKNAKKCWILNTIHDRARREHICDLLAKKNMYFIVLPLNQTKFDQAQTKEEKITAAIAINRARNFCIHHGKTLSRFSIILDGDCFFTENLWNQVHDGILNDQKTNKRKYYSIPCSRDTMEHAKISDKPMLLAEPMPVFKYDSTFLFDETRPFGKGDKLELLFRLNHSKEFGKNYILDNETLCKSIGLVHHVTASDYEIETNFSLRNKLRNESIDVLLEKVSNIDNFYPEIVKRRHGKPNEYWKRIQGFFDFRGIYSHFAWELPENSKFVEVGSWLGASIVYLAQEFINRGKKAEVFCVDTWQGSKEESHIETIRKIGGYENLYKKFLQNIKDANVENIIKPMKMTSTEASKLFEDESLDVVFIDASHNYNCVLEDLKNWYPKVKKGGKIAGHDYYPSHPKSDLGVVPAVQTFFKNKNLESSPAGRTWLHRKIL